MLMMDNYIGAIVVNRVLCLLPRVYFLLLIFVTNEQQLSSQSLTRRLLCNQLMLAIQEHKTDRKQVQFGFLQCIKYVPAEFRVDPYIKVKGQTEVKVM